MSYKDYRVKIVEVGGDVAASYLPASVYARTTAVIYVLDLTAPAQVEAAKQTLECLMTHEYLRGKPFMLFGNKADDIRDEDRRELVKDMDAFNNWTLTCQRNPKPEPEVCLEPIIWFRSERILRASLKLLLSKVRLNYDAILRRAAREQAKIRDAQIQYDEELLCRSSEEEPKIVKGTEKSNPPSNTVRKVVSCHCLRSIFTTRSS
jgi:GTPase SAR1 family protein